MMTEIDSTDAKSRIGVRGEGASTVSDDTEGGMSDRLPTAAYPLILSVLFEQATFFGIRNQLNVYLQTALGLSPSLAKANAHLFVAVTFLFPMVGAMISDSYLGKFKTIIIVSMVYLMGTVSLSILSINGLVGAFGNYPMWSFLIPTLFIAMGSGGIMPNASAMGGDQLINCTPIISDRFFTWFMLAVNLGGLVGQYVTPYIKEYVTCFNAMCYPLSFGVTSVFFSLSLISFLAGSPYYRKVAPQYEFLPYKSIRLTFTALKNYYREDSTVRAQSNGNWLKFAQPDFSLEFINETRLVGRLLIMLLPLTFCFMLFDQHGTEWQNQYVTMNKQFLNMFYLPTESSATVKYILAILFLPLNTFLLYPTLERFNIRLSEVSKMTLGYALIILGFVISIILDHFIEINNEPLFLNSDELLKKCEGCYNGGWQLPQMIVLALGESIVFPTVIQFCYTQVGPQMKASASSLWLLMVALGNASVLVIETALSSVSSTIYRQCVFVLIASVSLTVFVLLSKFWFVSKETLDLTLMEDIDQSFDTKEKGTQF